MQDRKTGDRFLNKQLFNHIQVRRVYHTICLFYLGKIPLAR